LPGLRGSIHSGASMPRKQPQVPQRRTAHTCSQLAVLVAAALVSGANVCQALLLLPRYLVARGDYMAVAASGKSGCLRGNQQLGGQRRPMLGKLACEWRWPPLCRCFLRCEFRRHCIEATVAAAAPAACCALLPAAMTLAPIVVPPSYQQASYGQSNPWVRATLQIQTTSPR